MIYLKSIIAGIVAAMAAVLLSALVAVLGTYAWLQFEMRRQSQTGGIGAVSAGIAETFLVFALALGLVGFAVGFRWQFRRASRCRP